MLDLESCIRLHENEAPLCIYINQKLDGPDTLIIGGTADANCGIQNIGTKLICEPKSGCNFDNLLALSLKAAFPVPKMTDITGAIANDLHFDMPGSWQEFFNIDVAGSECLGSFRCGSVEGGCEVGTIEHRSHSAATTTRDCLEHDAIPRCQAAEKILRF